MFFLEFRNLGTLEILTNPVKHAPVPILLLGGDTFTSTAKHSNPVVHLLKPKKYSQQYLIVANKQMDFFYVSLKIKIWKKPKSCVSFVVKKSKS